MASSASSTGPWSRPWMAHLPDAIACYFRQYTGVNRIKTVQISTRPRNNAAVNIHNWKSLRLPYVLPGPTTLRHGPKMLTLARLDVTEDMESRTEISSAKVS